MGKFRQLSHVYYKCEYHVVFVPKYRFRGLRGTLKIQEEQDLLAISQWKEVKVMEQNVQSDHVHMVCSIPPKISVSAFDGIVERSIGDANLSISSKFETKTLLGQSFFGKRLLH